MKLPPVYKKVLDIIQETDSDRRTTIEEEIVRRFRLTRDDSDGILKDLENKGLIKRTKFSIDVKV